MNISGEFYKEFAMPYDAKILDYYDGGLYTSMEKAIIHRIHEYHT